jgi:hypothetical protein
MSKRRNNILAALRRRRKSLGRFVASLFALASLTIASAPCFAMTAQAADAQVDVAEHSSHESHEMHSHQQGDHGNASHSIEHQAASERVPKPCPHCPLGTAQSHSGSGDHSFCSAFDEPSDQTSVTWQPPAAKYVLLVATFESPPPLTIQRRSTRPPPGLAHWQSPIALNLRHCVFLI